VARPVITLPAASCLLLDRHSASSAAGMQLEQEDRTMEQLA
jgi:hypothetical protein